MLPRWERFQFELDNSAKQKEKRKSRGYFLDDVEPHKAKALWTHKTDYLIKQNISAGSLSTLWIMDFKWTKSQSLSYQKKRVSVLVTCSTGY